MIWHTVTWGRSNNCNRRSDCKHCKHDRCKECVDDHFRGNCSCCIDAILGTHLLAGRCETPSAKTFPVRAPSRGPLICTGMQQALERAKHCSRSASKVTSSVAVTTVSVMQIAWSRPNPHRTVCARSVMRQHYCFAGQNIQSASSSCRGEAV